MMAKPLLLWYNKFAWDVIDIHCATGFVANPHKLATGGSLSESTLRHPQVSTFFKNVVVSPVSPGQGVPLILGLFKIYKVV